MIFQDLTPEETATFREAATAPINEPWPPWVPGNRNRVGVYGTLSCGHYTIVAECGGHSCKYHGREGQRANARLIAAAPALLAVAKALLQRGPVGLESECHWCGCEGNDTENCSGDDCMGTLARAAIAKAEGRA